ncbi:efflux RND transporter permease subunit [Shinella sp. CPCC 101442]|uniref:efflux RND transporter permease subunit n=1 Tax=Shinella sp. CPCC 101442 TaxID=2932265 RepID=UPI002152FCC3|nr:efflux RND transporter permease subunit [Shinella sp. CPCC 101442]MCR6502932.1 efflux RND transporter permease subunit [Shinella sp. CPCC 101442]
MSRFFVDRPVFAWVIAIVIMLAGLLAVRLLAVAQYPQVAPITVRISATYPGADAVTVENAVTKVIEQGLTGIDHLDYVTATSTATGQADVSVVFTSAADPDIAQVQVQNKVQLVTSQLPQAVQANGLTVARAGTGFFMVVALASSDGRLKPIDLADLIDSDINDPIRRIDGVGDLQIFGSGYAMRLWVDPAKLLKYQLMIGDVQAAVEAQNVQVSAGQLGALPQLAGQQLNATVTAKSRLQTPEQFENIIVKSAADGAVVRLRDVARVEIGAESYVRSGTYNNRNAAGFGIQLASNANALDVAANVRATLDRVKAELPEGVEIHYPYDTAPFVQLSLESVVEALFEAIVLVFVVMYLFLQNFRATLIPTLAIPVVLLGTFGILALFGFTINTLTMFAMVLAIGLLVDDAIVVVENVERLMAEEKLSPREAAIRSMRQISGALVGIAAVLSAVFVPMAFFPGSVGVIYRQFSITIVSAMVLSVLVALVFTPALCATLLKARHDGPRRGPLGLFERLMERMTTGYGRATEGLVRRAFRFLVVFLALSVAAGWLFYRLPTSFLPPEDQGRLLVTVQMPAGATIDRTTRVQNAVIDYFLTQEKDTVDGVFGSVGFNFSGQGQNVALAFVSLKDFRERTAPGSDAQSIARRTTQAFSGLKDGRAFVIAPPAIQGFGNAAGFEFYLLDTANTGREALVTARSQLLAAASQNPALTGTRPNGLEDAAQYAITIDQDKASAMNLSLADIDATLSAAWGSRYINDFDLDGRIKPVYIQGESDARMQPDDLDKWHVRNADGEMVAFSAFSSGAWTAGSPRRERYNGLPAVQIQGAANGVSSGTAMREVEELVRALPPGYALAWSGLSAQEEASGNSAMQLFALSVLVVFLSLAALYESWTIPFAVLLSAPIGIFGALAAATLFDQANDIYFKVGLLTTMGLAAKNAILIIEFAVEKMRHGADLVPATVEAARQRLRPILMTSFAFILGVLPLALAQGPGSNAQNAIGIGVMGGTIASTILGTFFIPLLFVVTWRVFKTGRGRRGIRAEHAAAPGTTLS